MKNKLHPPTYLVVEIENALVDQIKDFHGCGNEGFLNIFTSLRGCLNAQKIMVSSEGFSLLSTIESVRCCHCHKFQGVDTYLTARLCSKSFLLPTSMMTSSGLEFCFASSSHRERCVKVSLRVISYISKALHAPR